MSLQCHLLLFVVLQFRIDNIVFKKTIGFQCKQTCVSRTSKQDFLICIVNTVPAVVMTN